MRSDRQSIIVIEELVSATNTGRKRAASSLLALLQSGQADATALNDVAAEFDSDLRHWFRGLCQRVGISY